MIKLVISLILPIDFLVIKIWWVEVEERSGVPGDRVPEVSTHHRYVGYAKVFQAFNCPRGKPGVFVCHVTARISCSGI